MNEIGDSIGIEILKAWGWPSIPLLLGLILDSVSTKPFKEYIAARIREARPLGGLSSAVRVFNDGFLSRLLGKEPGSITFVFKSIIISAISLAFIVLVQGFAVKMNLSGVSALLLSYYSIGVAPLSALIVANVIVDYISNTITVSVLRMVARTDSELDFIVGLLGDITLTMASFMIIFPVGIVVASLIIEYQTDAARIDIAPRNSLTAFPALNNSNFLMTYFNITNSTTISTDPTSSSTTIFSFANPDTTDVSKQLNNIFSLMDADSDNSYVIGGLGEAVIPLHFKVPSLQELRARYNVAFSGVNVVRDNFGNVIHLSTVGFRLSSLYKLNNSPPNVGALVFECGKYPLGKQTRIMSTQGREIEDVVKTCDDHLESILGIIGFSSVRDMAFATKTNDTILPIAALFLTSFVTSLMYYLGIVITALGLRVNRLLSGIFSATYFRTRDMPFTFLGAISTSVLLVAFLAIKEIVTWVQ